MYKPFFLLITLFISVYAPFRAAACDYCIASQGISPVELGSTGIRYDLRYLHLGNLYQSGSQIENPFGLQETFVTHQLSGHYLVTDIFTASLFVPFSSRSALVAGTVSDTARTKGGQQPQHHDTDHPVTRSDYVAGLADIIVMGKLRLLDENDNGDDPLTLVASAGVKLPTGQTDRKTSDGKLLDQHLQLGSGSFDFLAGLSLLKALDDLTLVTTLLTIFPTEGANGYKYGTNVNYDFGMRYRFIQGEEVGGSLFGALSLLGEVRSKESKDDVIFENTGGHTAYIGLGAVYFLSPKISVEASYQHPILHALNGTQLGESYRIAAGAQYLF